VAVPAAHGRKKFSPTKKVGPPLGTGSPEKARSVVSVVFTPTRGVIHPSFPLRGRWERVVKNGEQAPSPSLTAPYTSSYETRLTQSADAIAQPLEGATSPAAKAILMWTMGMKRVQGLRSKVGLHAKSERFHFRFGRYSELAFIGYVPNANPGKPCSGSRTLVSIV
jgi:hypothetical protein